MDGGDLRRYRADRLLRTELGAWQSRICSIVRARLRSHGVTVDEGDLEQCYFQAWHSLHAALLAGRNIEDHAGWLVVAAERRALEERRSLISRATDSTDRIDRVAPAAGADLAAELDGRVRLRHLFEALRTKLTSREREIVTLCYLHGLSRSQAAAEMGISERRITKLMDGEGGRPGVARKWNDLLRQLDAGDWCEQQSSLIRAYAMYLLPSGGERHRLAEAHLSECPGCRSLVRCLRGLAAVLPPLALPPAPSAPVEPHAAAGGHNRAFARLRAVSRRLAAGLRPSASRAVMGGRVGTPVFKLALAGALTVAVGGYAVLAGTAPGHGAAGRAPRIVAVPRGAPAPPEARRVATRVPAPLRAPSRSRHRARPTGSNRVRRLAAPSPPPETSAGGQPQSAPQGEFTPERPSR